jgi:hypothetical protein
MKANNAEPMVQGILGSSLHLLPVHPHAMQSFLGEAGKGGNALKQVAQREGVDNSLFRVSPFMLVDLLLCKDDGVAKTAIVESHDSP